MRWTLVACCITWFACLTSCSSATPQSERLSTIDDVFRRPELESGFWRRHEFAVTIRFTSEDELERQITLVEGQNGVSATVIEAVGTPLSEQLRDGSHPVRTRRFELADTDLLAPLVRSFRELRVSLDPPRVIYLHPDTTTIWATTMGGSATIYMIVPPARGTAVWGAPHDWNPDIYAWARHVEQVILQAAGR